MVIITYLQTHSGDKVAGVNKNCWWHNLTFWDLPASYAGVHLKGSQLHSHAYVCNINHPPSYSPGHGWLGGCSQCRGKSFAQGRVSDRSRNLCHSVHHCTAPGRDSEDCQTKLHWMQITPQKNITKWAEASQWKIIGLRVNLTCLIANAEHLWRNPQTIRRQQPTDLI